jgi:hypothetical protein
MKRLQAALAAALLALLATPAWADRTPSVRSEGQQVSPARNDIRVPYLTGAYRVAPLIYAAPVADDLGNPGARPTFNLPFYGARMGFSGVHNGYVPKPTLLPSQAR